jgi:hypothetical protein
MRKFVRMTVPFAFGLILLVLGSTTVSWATPVPEIDPSTGMSALALLAGAVLVVRAWHNK